jgi:hypothetical protein
MGAACKKLFFGSLICILLITSCTLFDPREKLYGKWAIDTSPDVEANSLGSVVFEFTSTGYLIISVSAAVAIQTVLQYDFVDKDTIVFSGEGSLSSLSGQTVDFTVDGDALTLISNGDIQTFHQFIETKSTP